MQEEPAADLSRLAVPPEAWSLQIQQDRAFQDSILPSVLPPFGLHLGALPEALHVTAANVSLLYRLGTVLQHRVPAAPAAKAALYAALEALLEGRRGASPDHLLRHLPQDASAAERELLRHVERVIRVTHALPAWQQQLITPHISAVWRAIAAYEARKGPQGLPTLDDFDDYCRRTGGELWQLLTALFCGVSGATNRRRARLLSLAPAFGQALQAVELLSRLQEDLPRGICWLPRDLFDRAGCPICPEQAWWEAAHCGDALDGLISLSQQRLQAAQAYVLLIPRQESGLRSFGAEAIAQSLLSLRRIHADAPFGPASGPRPSLRQSRALASLGRRAAGHDWLLQTYFHLAGRGLPHRH